MGRIDAKMDFCKRRLVEVRRSVLGLQPQCFLAAKIRTREALLFKGNNIAVYASQSENEKHRAWPGTMLGALALWRQGAATKWGVGQAFAWLSGGLPTQRWWGGVGLWIC